RNIEKLEFRSSEKGTKRKESMVHDKKSLKILTGSSEGAHSLEKVVAGKVHWKSLPDSATVVRKMCGLTRQVWGCLHISVGL
ncbi:Unknown protein, partial [Striga hermonthica]